MVDGQVTGPVTAVPVSPDIDSTRCAFFHAFVLVAICFLAHTSFLPAAPSQTKPCAYCHAHALVAALPYLRSSCPGPLAPTFPPPR